MYLNKFQLLLTMTTLLIISQVITITEVSSGICPKLQCSSLSSSNTCVSPQSPSSITLFNCAAGGYSCSTTPALDGQYFLDVPTANSPALVERDCQISSATGSPCTTNQDCQTFNCVNSVCQAGVLIQSSYCTNSLQCSGNTLQCLPVALSPSQDLCVPLLQQSKGPCSSSSDCIGDLWCDSKSTNLCLQKRAYSKACQLDQQCQLGFCDRKACRPNLSLFGVGGPCISKANCKSNLQCIDLKKNNNSQIGQDGVADTCGEKIANNGTGCLQDSDCADSGAICIDLINKNTGATNSPDGQIGDTCKTTKLLSGEIGCLLDSHCDNASNKLASYCNKLTSPFKCEKKSLTGSTCSANYYCLSDICVDSKCSNTICNQHSDCGNDLNGNPQYCDLHSTFMCNPKFTGDYAAYECSHSYQCDTGFFCNTLSTPANCQAANAATGSACLDDNQCSIAGDICLSGSCQSNKCRKNDDCSNQYCNLSNNTCTTFITRGSSCANDLQCDTTDDFCDSSDSTCKQQLAILKGCSRDQQCSGNKICLNNQCQQYKCKSDNDCQSNQFCNNSNNLCLTTTTKALGVVCQTDKYCTAPNQCIEVTLQNSSKQKQCSSQKCEEDAHCKSNPVTQYCNTSTKLCTFKADRNSECQGDNQCSSSDATDICYFGRCIAKPVCVCDQSKCQYYYPKYQACVDKNDIGGHCTLNDGCKSGICVNSQCTTSKADGSQCTLQSNSQCNNVCVFEKSTAKYKCQPQLTVGNIQFQCDEDADCQNYATLDSKCIKTNNSALGYCKAYPIAGVNCNQVSECPSDHQCVGTNICQQYSDQRCSKDAHCKTGQACIDHDYDKTIDQGGDKCAVLSTPALNSHCIKQQHCGNTGFLYCDLANDRSFSYRKCQAKKSYFLACAANFQCSSNVCISSACASAKSPVASPCDEDADCMSSAWCHNSICNAKVASGQSCSPASDKCLNSGQNCYAASISTYTCTSPHTAGQYCKANSDCATSHYCNPSNLCQLVKGFYSNCDISTNPCDSKSYKCQTLSSASKCLGLGVAGVSCVNDTSCAEGFFCSTINFTCLAYKTVTGQSCAGADNKCWQTHFCSSISNTCLKKYSKNLGELAQTDQQCLSGKRIFSRCISLKVIHQRIKIEYPYQCEVGKTCGYVSDDGAEFQITTANCACAGVGGNIGFCPIVEGVKEFQTYAANFRQGSKIGASAAALSAWKLSEYKKQRNALLHNCDLKTCIASIDPNWPVGATIDNLGLTCAVSSLPTLGYFIKMSGLVVVAVTMIGMIDL